MLIDDDPADLQLFARVLRKVGFDVVATLRPDEALAQIVRGDVGCVVTDQAMTLTGHELVEIVRGVRSDISIVFLSGAQHPTHPLPAGATFVNKGDSAALEKAVMDCMSRWLVA